MPPATTSSGISQTRCTHPRLHIRSAHEAHTLFEAVRLGLLPIVRRRLSPTDKELESGEVFVWEEASYKGGLERWTDGKKWSQSRMREPFLFYEEKAMPSREEREAKIARRACRSLGSPDTPPPLPASPSSRRRDRPAKVRGLTKQTYSAYVSTENGAPAKKWHLTAYFCGTSYHELPTVNDDSILRNIIVPKGVYVTGKGLTRNQRRTGADSTTPVLPPSPSNPNPPATESAVEPWRMHRSESSAPSSITTTGPSSESSVTAPNTDDGSQSPWSMSSMDPLPQTPPLYAHHQRGPGPSPSYHPTPAYPYHAPQPQYPVTSFTVPSSDSPSPVVVHDPHHSSYAYSRDPHSSSSSSLMGLHRSHSYEEQKPYPYAPPPHSYQQPPAPPAAPVSYPGPAPPPKSYPFPHLSSASPPTHHAYVGYPSSDAREEYYPPPPPLPSLSAAQKSSSPTTPTLSFGPSAPALPASAASLRYAARHTLDQRALGAFRVQL